MKTLAKTRAIGGSLVVTIPRKIVKEKSLRADQTIETTIESTKKEGFGILKGLETFTDKDRRDMWRERV